MTRFTLLFTLLLCVVPAQAQLEDVSPVGLHCNTVAAVIKAFGRLPMWISESNGEHYYLSVEDFLRYVDAWPNMETCFPYSPRMTNEQFIQNLMTEEELISTLEPEDKLTSTLGPEIIQLSGDTHGNRGNLPPFDVVPGIYQYETHGLFDASRPDPVQIRLLLDPPGCLDMDTLDLSELFGRITVSKPCRVYPTLSHTTNWSLHFALEHKWEYPDD